MLDKQTSEDFRKLSRKHPEWVYISWGCELQFCSVSFRHVRISESLLLYFFQKAFWKNSYSRFILIFVTCAFNISFLRHNNLANSEHATYAPGAHLWLICQKTINLRHKYISFFRRIIFCRHPAMVCSANKLTDFHIRHHPFNTYAQVFQKLTFLTH